ncbi:MAG: TIR domain-containing protein [Lachnospiraceae bacterium]|nr:TIR domain-containing protein [Lachnospiraceae bacterium]
MNELHCKTRGNTSPGRKPCVYFTCHPQDFPVYFDSVVSDILAVQDCAIWYNAEPDSPWEDIEFDLKQMQLFVIPVTSHFLYEDNRARSIEFPYALKHHIPVLPLMMESGLEKDFNRVCGDLQFLDVTSAAADPTALPYKDKLQLFLRSVFPGNQILLCVRSAFNATIFLSYRKQDRKDAQELMKFIHQNNFCRDIAIWYDEFLTPGENFNQAIQEIIEKSQLFVLVVTPSLVSRDNYVMKIEYPAAYDMGLSILPAEMKSTDRESLQKCYPGIPEIIDAHDSVSLSSALKEALRGALISKNTDPDDPQHLYYIGLAYLLGIDVEVDYGQAVSLITSAADSGLDEAIKKLTDMYQNGEGVPRDLQTAICWQKKYVAVKEENYRNSQTGSNKSALLGALLELGDFYRELRSTDSAKQIFLEILELCADSSANFSADSSADSQNFFISACRRLGDLSAKERKHYEAEMYYRKAFSQCEAAYQKNPSSQITRGLCGCYSDLASICLAQLFFDDTRLQDAHLYNEKALHLCRQLAEEAQTLDNLQLLAGCYANMGYICGLEARRSIEDTAIPEASRSIEDTIIPENSHSPQAAPDELSCLEQAKAIYLSLADNTNVRSVREGLAAVLINLGTCHFNRKDYIHAASCFLQALSEANSLASDFETVDAYKLKSRVYQALGELSGAQRDIRQAQVYYKKSAELLSSLSLKTNAVELWHELITCYEKLSGFLEKTEELSEARSCLEQAQQHAEAIVKKQNSPESREDLVYVYSDIANLCTLEGSYDDAVAYHNRTIQLYETLKEETGKEKLTDTLLKQYLKIGDYCKKGGAAAIRTVLNGQEADISTRYDRFGTVMSSRRFLADAMNCYEKGALLCCQLIENAIKLPEMRRYLSWFYPRISEIYELKKEPVSRKWYFKRGFALREALSGDQSMQKHEYADAVRYYDSALTEQEALAGDATPATADAAPSASGRRQANGEPLTGKNGRTGETKSADDNGRTDKAEEKKYFLRERAITYYHSGKAWRALWEADFFDDGSKRDKAFAHLQSAQKLFSKLYDLTRAKADYQFLLNCCFLQGQLYVTLCPSEQDMEAALKCYEKVYELYLSSAKSVNDPASRRLFVRCCAHLGDAWWKKDRTMGWHYYDQQCRVGKALVQEAGTIEDIRALATCYSHTASVCRLAGIQPDQISGFQLDGETYSIESLLNTAGSIYRRYPQLQKEAEELEAYCRGLGIAAVFE